MNILEKIQQENLRKNLPEFKAGDTVRVHTKIREGEKERVQVYEGVVLRTRAYGTQASFTVRKVSYGIGVERVFPTESPMIDKVEVVTRGKVRRAKLYYIRDLSGKKARIEGEEVFQGETKAKKAAAAQEKSSESSVA